MDKKISIKIGRRLSLKIGNGPWLKKSQCQIRVWAVGENPNYRADIRICGPVLSEWRLLFLISWNFYPIPSI